jgi:diguanylate cyclase (GGDEF)-like protein
MYSDPSTLVQVSFAIALMAALAYWIGVRALGFHPAAGRDWAGANLFFAASMLALMLRGTWPNVLLYAAGDSAALAGFALLRAGFERLLGRASSLREHVGVVIGAALIMVIAYALGWPLLRLAVNCAAAAWLLGRGGWTASQGLRGEFGTRAALLVAGPLLLASAMQVLRLLGGVFSPHGTQTTNLLLPTGFNVMLLWTAMLIALALNFATAAFAGARQLARIRALTLRDPLTGLFNRRALDALLQREVTQRQRHGLPLSVVFFDLDRFKALNDRLGHAAGDAALRHAAQTIAGACRDGDTVARIGGEEFCVLLPYTDAIGGTLMAERMRGTLEAATFRWGAELLHVTASFGVASAEAGNEDAAHLLARADHAMYAAKSSGRNCVVAAPALHEATRKRGA